MRGIYYLLTRFYVLITFVFLEIVALTLIYKTNSYQEVKFLNTSNAFAGNILEKFNSINSFFHLGSNNEALQEENVRLKNLIQYQDSYPTDSILPTSTLQYRFKYIAAKVVNNSINKSINYITIDKGKKDGIVKGLGIVSSNGVVGIITNVSENFSLAMSVISVKTQISVRHQKTDALGNLHWNGENPFLLQVGGLSKTLPIKKNDTIVTAGFSSLFPPNIPVAIVKTLEPDESSSFYRMDVQLTNNINSLRYIYVVKNERKNEIDSLEMNRINE
ncbi:MAG: rod shape-determining protein MreC [Chitinophagales bacterium]|nr:rod shape-determining protein MreC [Bacteroidota bacterium]